MASASKLNRQSLEMSRKMDVNRRSAMLRRPGKINSIGNLY